MALPVRAALPRAGSLAKRTQFAFPPGLQPRVLTSAATATKPASAAVHDQSPSQSQSQVFRVGAHANDRSASYPQDRQDRRYRSKRAAPRRDRHFTHSSSSASLGDLAASATAIDARDLTPSRSGRVNPATMGLLRRRVRPDTDMAPLADPEPVLAPPPLPEMHTITVEGNCVLEYFDLQPAGGMTAETPTFVFTHGAPGSNRDFRYIAPMLQAQSGGAARVLAFNMPGVGQSRAVDERERLLRADTKHATHAIHSALTTLCRNDPHVFISGHSFGGYAAIKLATEATQQQLLQVRGLVLIASIGDRVHRTMSPFLCHVFARVVKADIPFLSWLAEETTRFIYAYILGFPKSYPTSFHVSALMRHASTDFDHVTTELAGLSGVPTFHAYAKDDHHLQVSISERLSSLCAPGPRVVFEAGGHNIQKTRAAALTRELQAWTRALASGQPSELVEREYR